MIDDLTFENWTWVADASAWMIGDYYTGAGVYQNSPDGNLKWTYNVVVDGQIPILGDYCFDSPEEAMKAAKEDLDKRTKENR